jgi:hypothetical protein
MIGLIPRPLHAVLDYLWGIAMIFAPETMGFKDNEAANAYCKARGGGMLLTSLMTRYELGLIKVIPFNVHLLLDLLSAAVSFAIPNLLGFDKNKKATQAVLAFSAFELGAVLLSKRDRK